MSVVHPASRLAREITRAPLMWIGERSYGIYLWHWVVFQVTRPSVDLVGEDWALYALRILIVFALADISYRWIEVPVRNGAIELWVRGLKYRTPAVRLRQKSLVAVAIVATLMATTTVSMSAIERADLLERQNTSTSGETSGIAGAEGGSASTEPVASPQGEDGKSGLWVTGDSVILGIRSLLEKYEPVDLVNARVGRQLSELIEVVQVDVKSVPNSIAILNVGNNGAISEESLVELFELLKGQPNFVVVNAAVPRGWRESNNKIVESVISRYPNARLVDWDRISTDHPEYFAPDGVHLVPTGANVYVASILEVLEEIGYRE